MSPGGQIVGMVVRIGVAILIPVIAFFILILGFNFLRANEADKWVVTIVAVIWGVGGVAMLYWIFNWLVEQLPIRSRAVLVLHHGYGYSLAEVAEILGLTHTNVRSIAARSRRRLMDRAKEADDA